METMMLLLVVVSVMPFVVSVPRCQIPTPTNTEACSSTDDWRNDLLCRVFGSYASVTSGTTTTSVQVFDGLMRDAIRLVTDTNKHRRKMANKAVSSFFSVRENLVNSRFNSSSTNDQLNTLINMEKQVRNYGRQILGESNWLDATCGLQVNSVTTGTTGQCGDRTDTTLREGSCPGSTTTTTTDTDGTGTDGTSTGTGTDGTGTDGTSTGTGTDGTSTGTGTGARRSRTGAGGRSRKR